jgi:hypothetical protein
VVPFGFCVVGVVPPGVVVVVVVVVFGAGAVTVNVCGVYKVVSKGSPSLTHSATTGVRRPAVASAGTVKAPCHFPWLLTGIRMDTRSAGAATAT